VLISHFWQKHEYEIKLVLENRFGHIKGHQSDAIFKDQNQKHLVIELLPDIAHMTLLGSLQEQSAIPVG
jgi:hypothetical protein